MTWVHFACAETDLAVRGYRCVDHPQQCPRCNFEVSQDTGGRMYADRGAPWSCEWCRIVPATSQMPPVWLPCPPIFADVLNKICLGMVRQTSLSLTAPESQVLVDGVEAMAFGPGPCVRRPDPDSERGYCGVRGWQRAPRSASEIIGFVRDAHEDSRSNNLNKSSCLTLLEAVELKVDRSMFLRSVRIADLPMRSNFPRHFTAKDVVRHRRSELPAIECTTSRPKEDFGNLSQ